MAVALAGSACQGGFGLANMRESPEVVARLVVSGLASRDVPALEALAVSEREFREVIWPRLPASRKERNVPWEYAWKDLSAKSGAHLRALAAGWKDQGYEVVSVAFRGATTEYGTFRIHRETEVVLRDRTGEEKSGRLFGSTIEKDGRFKVFSYVVD